MLKSNLNLIKLVDDTIKSLIKSRYPSINEYKQKIKQGINLPSYIRSVLKENNYFPANEEIKLDSTTSKNVSLNANNLHLKLISENVQGEAHPPLYSPFSVETKTDMNQRMLEEINDLEEPSELSEMFVASIDLNREVFVDNIIEVEQPAVFFRELTFPN